MKDQPVTYDPNDGQDAIAGDMPAMQEFAFVSAPTYLQNGEHSLEALYDVPVKVQAVLGRARMPIGDLLKLQVGTVVELDRRVGEPVDIFVNNRLIARGEVVLIDNALGVTLTEIVREEN